MLYFYKASKKTQFSKHNSKQEHQRMKKTMLKNGTKCHYLAMKSLPRSLDRITSNHKDDHMNCLHSVKTKSSCMQKSCEYT